MFDEVVAILGQARDAGAIREDVPLTDLAVILIGGILVHFTIYPSKAAGQESEGASTRFVDFLFELLGKGAAP